MFYEIPHLAEKWIGKSRFRRGYGKGEENLRSRPDFETI